MSRFSIDELLAANQVLWDFLDAVRSLDEATVDRLLFPASAGKLEAPRGRLAATFLDRWAVPPDELARLAVVHSARVIDDELVGFGIIVSDPGDAGPMGTNLVKVIDGPRPARALALIKTETPEGWQVWGMPDPDEWSAAEIIPLPPPTYGPIN
jgi:hypothetical protein